MRDNDDDFDDDESAPDVKEKNILFQICFFY